MLHSSLSCFSLTINPSFTFLLHCTFIYFTFTGHPLSNPHLYPPALKAAPHQCWMLTCDCGSWCWRTRRPLPWACPVWWWWTGCCRGAHWCVAAANAQMFDPWGAPRLRKRGGEIHKKLILRQSLKMNGPQTCNLETAKSDVVFMVCYRYSISKIIYYLNNNFHSHSEISHFTLTT